MKSYEFIIYMMENVFPENVVWFRWTVQSKLFSSVEVCIQVNNDLFLIDFLCIWCDLMVLLWVSITGLYVGVCCSITWLCLNRLSEGNSLTKILIMINETQKL